jgi:PAS domain S-box-containing protein
MPRFWRTLAPSPPTRVVLGLVVVLVLLLQFVVLGSYQVLTESADRQRRNLEAVQTTSALLRAVLNMETGMRGYLLSGSEAHLEPYASGRAEFRDQLVRARTLAADDKLLQLLEQVEHSERGWREGYAQPLIEQRRAAGESVPRLLEVLRITRQGVGKAYTDRIRTLLRDAAGDASERLEAERRRIETSYQRTALLLVAGGVVVLILVVGLLAGLARNLRALTAANTQLKNEVEQRRQVEAVLRTSEQRLGLALAGAGLALFDCEVSREQVYLSQQWAMILGDPPQPTRASLQALEDLVHPDDLPALRRALQALLQGERSDFRLEARVRTRTGNWKWVESLGKVVERSAEGHPLRVTGISADITARKAIDQLKSEFASTVSHELRTPLTAIMGAVGVLRGDLAGELPEQARAFLEMAHQNTERLAELLSSMLDLERLESGLLALRLRPLELNGFLARAVGVNQPYAQRLGVKLETSPAADSCWVQADADRLLQAVTNLMTNAAKFSPQDEAVTVWCEPRGGTARILVRDRGPGIPEEFRARIFQRFAQADSSDTRQREGAGLGLSIAKALVERMGGSIGFETRIGEGTTFFIDLPLAPRLPPELESSLGSVV